MALLRRHLLYPFGNNRLLRGRDLNFNYTWHGRRLKFWAFYRGFFSMMVLVQKHQIEVDLLTCAMQSSPEGFHSVTEHKALSW